MILSVKFDRRFGTIIAEAPALSEESDKSVPAPRGCNISRWVASNIETDVVMRLFV